MMDIPALCVLVCLHSFLMVEGSPEVPILSLPERSPEALDGNDVVELLENMPSEEREETIYAQIAAGNVPDFLRRLCSVGASSIVQGNVVSATFFVTPEYFALGNDANYFLCPMTPGLAQRVANLLQCTLPTRKMVDDVYVQSALKLEPAPIAPSSEMTTVPVFAQHNTMVFEQRANSLATHPLGSLVGGHKKDVVITNKLVTAPPPPRVAIYGWHKIDGTPIQPLYTGHGYFYVDYSHGIRLVHRQMILDEKTADVHEVLADPVLAPVLSDEGAISTPQYPVP